MKPNRFKRVASVFLMVALTASAVMLSPFSRHHQFTAHAESGCSNATLSGTYAVTFSGFQRQNDKSVPFYGSGIATFEAGNITATSAYSIDGVGSTNITYTATYAVNPDCTVLITATPGSGGDNFFGAIVGRGREILATDISEPDTLNLDAKKQ